MRHIGIIGDGETDYRVFKKIAEILLANEVEVIELRRQTLHDAVDKYWKDIRKNDSILQKEVKAILNAALSDFQSGIKENLTCKDILLLTTDAEKRFAALNNEQIYWDSNSDYFGILHCLMNAIRDFYSIQYKRGYPPENLPTMIPIVTFPSAEPFLLIAKGEKTSNINGKTPTDLKIRLYRTDNPCGEAIEQAIKEISEDKVYEILKIIPESRFFIQTFLMLK
jgi:hypothetical protein